MPSPWRVETCGNLVKVVLDMSYDKVLWPLVSYKVAPAAAPANEEAIQTAVRTPSLGGQNLSPVS